MQAAITRSSGRRARRVPLAYPTRLQLYRQHPESEISIDELEQLASGRLQVLRAVETARVRSGKDEAEFRTTVLTAEKQHNLQLSLNADDDTQQKERARDVISHFVLRLAFCRNEDLRRWFVAQECALFRHRFNMEPLADRNAFMAANVASAAQISAEEKERLRSELQAICAIVKTQFETEDFYRLRFEQVPELVSSRRVLLKEGDALVASTDLVSILVNVFRTELSAALLALSRVLPELEEDERLLPTLMELSRQSTAPEYVSRTGTDAITADEVDGLAKHFPLCMRHLHANLTADSHLRHFGRIQFGLFLKGMGLNLQESLIYWRRAFAAKIPDDKFQKNYAYNIRYNYGQEGKRVDAAPFDCVRIIMNNPPGAGDHHGCPFRHFDQDNLRATMAAMDVAEGTIAEIIDLVRGRHYQIACTRYYEATHKVDGHIPPISHPNQYLDLSMGRATSRTAGMTAVKQEEERATTSQVA